MSSAKSLEKDGGKFPPVSSKFAEVRIAGPNSKFSLAAEQARKSGLRSTFKQFSEASLVNLYETEFWEDGNNATSQIVRTLAFLKGTNFGVIPVKHQPGRRKVLMSKTQPSHVEWPQNVWRWCTMLVHCFVITHF